MSYQKLPDVEDSSGFNYEEISKNLKIFDKKIKEFQKAAVGSGKSSILKEIEIIQQYLTNIFRRPRISKNDKAKLLPLENQCKELNAKFQEIRPQEIEDSRSSREENLANLGVEERDSLAYKDSAHLKEEQLLERKENIENLQRDFIQVNELFKDTAMLVREQGAMLEEAEKNVIVADNEIKKGVNELRKADKYQQKAKGKL